LTRKKKRTGDFPQSLLPFMKGEEMTPKRTPEKGGKKKIVRLYHLAERKRRGSTLFPKKEKKPGASAKLEVATKKGESAPSL